MERKLFDKRTTDRYVDRGIVKASEVAAHLKGLPDDANNAQYVELDLHDTELPGDNHGNGSDPEAS